MKQSFQQRKISLSKTDGTTSAQETSNTMFGNLDSIGVSDTLQIQLKTMHTSLLNELNSYAVTFSNIHSQDTSSNLQSDFQAGAINHLQKKVTDIQSSIRYDSQFTNSQKEILLVQLAVMYTSIPNIIKLCFDASLSPKGLANKISMSWFSRNWTTIAVVVGCAAGGALLGMMVGAVIAQSAIVTSVVQAGIYGGTFTTVATVSWSYAVGGGILGAIGGIVGRRPW